jgi:hypothetical protein
MTIRQKSGKKPNRGCILTLLPLAKFWNDKKDDDACKRAEDEAGPDAAGSRKEHGS